ncbi:unnamed protein product (macronuclear) [Paramecium tetraurelia]|uniref:HTH myb-type domain-containing protein n=1 Tax=Paramecium tetraurelia TaxID=5888 RepID=A0BNH4_PARTE|nr:uncharacterized protein GSPATT00030729001 [Paramecium tetraurelia]CAK60091.1 unnamed protein product [Paramecium tetraurelia]|eukprot:XP_001427489.1 hypothetical protein (macronuclear) [Paramecium tetraurelia strain d4-2]
MKKIQKQTIKLRNQQQSLQNEYEDLISSRERQLSQNNHSKTDAIPQAQQDQQNIEQQIDQNRIRQTKSRSWHKRLDCRVNHSEMKEGRFSKQEVDCIMKVVNEYLLQNNLSNQDLQEYIELKSFGLSKIWLSIAKQIPNRSVDSIYKLIRRKYDSNNRHGYWSQNEEADLIKYVQQYGRKWREISKHFNRTPDNIRTKQENSQYQ